MFDIELYNYERRDAHRLQCLPEQAWGKSTVPPAPWFRKKLPLRKKPSYNHNYIYKHPSILVLH